MTNRTEELASKAMGGMKSAKATMHGLTGVFKHLTREHGEVSALLMRVKMSSDPAVRRELFPKIRQELVSHEQGESREVYPIYRQYPETQRLAEDHDADVLQLNAVITELTQLPFEADAWKEVFDKLVTLVQEHVHDEESKYFPAGQHAFGHRAEAMLQSYERAKAEVIRELNATS